MKVFFTAIFLLFTVLTVKSQKIFGFVDNQFVSTELATGSKDTLIVFDGEPWINLAFRATIDRFNGRYYFGGSIPGHPGLFHVIDLMDLSIESFSPFPENMEHDFLRKKIVYEKNGSFYALDLNTSGVTLLGIIENGNSSVYGQKRTYNPQTNQYLYLDYKDGTDGPPYYLLVNAETAELDCEVVVEIINGIHYSPGGFVTNIMNGDIIAHRNGRYGIVSPCDGLMTRLTQIPDYHSHLNNQMAVYDHNSDTYIIPYYTTIANDRHKYAIVDVYNDEIVQILNQPWEGKMNLQQIYDRPQPPLIYSNDALYVPQGLTHTWYLNNELLRITSDNFIYPTESGTYHAEVEFREYVSTTPEVLVTMVSTDEIVEEDFFEIFPNPASNNIFIRNRTGSGFGIQIINSAGQVLYNSEIGTAYRNLHQIDLSHLNSSIYIILLKTNDTVSYRKLIIK